MIKILSGFGFFYGASYPFKACYLFFKKPYLLKYLIIPILLNLLLGIILYLSVLLPSWNYVENLLLLFSNWLYQLIDNLPYGLTFLTYFILAIGWGIKIFIILGLFCLIGIVLVQFGNILGSPWYGQLSEELERIKTGKVDFIEVNLFVDIYRAIIFELKKIQLFIVVALPLFLLNFIPTFGNLISLIGTIILTSIIVCLDFIDAPLERRRLSFSQKLSLVCKSFPASFGFSLVCLGLISFPFLNLLIIPICVASGTLFFCDFLQQKL